MTVRGKSVGNSTERRTNRDILFKLLCQKPSSKSRLEAVHSYPSQISRKLLLEEHKLSKQLEKIEKERKQFLNKNSREKYLLQLSLRGSNASESRKSSGQCLVINHDARCLLSPAEYGDKKLRKSWTSTTNGVFVQSGAKNIRQLHIKKVCLLKKMAERHGKANPLPRKHSFNIPEVPPPSRSPSKTSIIWVDVRNSSGAVEIDGFLRTSKDGCFEQLIDKDDMITTKTEDTVRCEQDEKVEYEQIPKCRSSLKIELDDLELDTDVLSGNPCEEKYSAMKNSDTDFGENEAGQKCRCTDPNASRASPRGTKKPTVISLKVLPNVVHRDSSVKENSEERAKTTKAQNKHSRTGNDKKFVDNKKCFTLKDKIKETTSSRVQNEKGDRTDARNDIVTYRQNVKRKVGRDRKKIEGYRQKIGSVRKCSRSNMGRGRKLDRKEVADDRSSIENDRNIRSGGKISKESKTKRHGHNSGESRNSYSMKIKKSKSVQSFVQTEPNVQGIRIFIKTFTTSTESKGKTGKKRQENKTVFPDKPRTATPLLDMRSETKLPRKSCSACTVKTSASYDVSGSKKIRSNSVTTACSKVQGAATLKQTGVVSPERKTQAPVLITLPSQTQLQNFDKVAKTKLCKTLAVKMRKHCYTGTWAFPC